MNSNSTLRGALIASAVAGMLACAASSQQGNGQAASLSAADDEGSFKCGGINECKGTGSCASASNECSGHNSCRSKGWLKTSSERECLRKGGKLI